MLEMFLAGFSHVEAIILLACYCTILLVGALGNGWFLISIGRPKFFIYIFDYKVRWGFTSVRK